MRIVVVIIAIMFISCKQEIKQEEFFPTYEKPFTKNLAHYKHAVNYYVNQEEYSFAKDIFPELELVENNQSSLVFIPRILQGESRFGLKIRFNDKAEAINFYQNKSKNTIKVFNGGKLMSGYEYSCLSKSLVGKDFQITENHEVSFIKMRECASKDTKELYGPVMGVALSKELREVLIWLYE